MREVWAEETGDGVVGVEIVEVVAGSTLGAETALLASTDTISRNVGDKLPRMPFLGLTMREYTPIMQLPLLAAVAVQKLPDAVIHRAMFVAVAVRMEATRVGDAREKRIRRTLKVNLARIW